MPKGIPGSRGVCSVDGCGRPHSARGYCKNCYKKRIRSGELEAVAVQLPWPENLLQRMAPQPNGCIYFVNGGIDDGGYGILNYPGGDGAHRASWSHFVGPIPDGMTVGHKCHDDDPTCEGGITCLHRRCVNVEHLALETMGENVHASANTPASINKAKTHCPKGHEFTPENTYVYPDGRRRCRTCNRDSDRQRKRELRAA